MKHYFLPIISVCLFTGLVISPQQALARMAVKCEIEWRTNVEKNVKSSRGVIPTRKYRIRKRKVRTNEYQRIMRQGGRSDARATRDRGQSCRLDHRENARIGWRIDPKSKLQLSPGGQLPNCSDLNATITCVGIDPETVDNKLIADAPNPVPSPPPTPPRFRRYGTETPPPVRRPNYSNTDSKKDQNPLGLRAPLVPPTGKAQKPTLLACNEWCKRVKPDCLYCSEKATCGKNYVTIAQFGNLRFFNISTYRNFHELAYACTDAGGTVGGKATNSAMCGVFLGLVRSNQYIFPDATDAKCKTNKACGKGFEYLASFTGGSGRNYHACFVK